VDGELVVEDSKTQGAVRTSVDGSTVVER
jgi:hypothetical protein